VKELVDIVSTYLALGMGLVVFWWGLFRNWPLDDCLFRALLAMVVVFLVGQACRFLMAVFLALGGGNQGRRGLRAGTERESKREVEEG
jgi:hypothetical protein